MAGTSWDSNRQKQREMVRVGCMCGERLCSLRWMFNPGDKCKVIETGKNSDYMLLFDSIHSLSTYYIP